VVADGSEGAVEVVGLGIVSNDCFTELVDVEFILLVVHVVFLEFALALLLGLQL